MYHFAEERSAPSRSGSADNLSSKITNSSDLSSLLDAIGQDVQLYNKDHLILSIRTLSRFLKGLSSNDINDLAGDERYSALTKRLSEVLEDFNEYGNTLSVCTNA